MIHIDNFGSPAAASGHADNAKTILLIGSFAESLVNFRGALIEDMIAAGHKVIAAAPDISKQTRATLQAFGAIVEDTPLARTGMNPLADVAYLRTLRTLIRRVRPDIVLTYTIKPNIWGAFAASSIGIRSVAMVTGLGYAFTGKGGLVQQLVRRLATFLYRQASNRNSLVIFQNPDDCRDFIDAGCLGDPGKVRMVNGSGVDTDHYQVAPLPDEPVFLMISRLLRNKGVREYGEAAVTVKKTHPHAQFHLVGFMDEGPDGIRQSELDAWIAGGLEYLGPKADVRPSIADASVYVLPSYREGTPRSVLEAMSMGRAIITSDAPGCRETTVDGENGFLVPVKDPETLAARMRLLIDNVDLRVAMGQKSREIAVGKYDVHAVNHTLMRHLGLVT